MAHTDKTLMLNEKWDITLNDAGNIVLAKDAYAVAQNVANECRLFTNDAYFAKDQGIPYFAFILGKAGATSVIRSRLRKAALNVAGVSEITDLTISDIDSENRTVTGEIRFLTTGGENGIVEI